ncbi:MAG: hypothetical protein IJP98_03995 [Clostridia bacterium]|nr:hypothetical protein [Clostridia bacterium]
MFKTGRVTIDEYPGTTNPVKENSLLTFKAGISEKEDGPDSKSSIAFILQSGGNCKPHFSKQARSPVNHEAFAFLRGMW